MAPFSLPRYGQTSAWSAGPRAASSAAYTAGSAAYFRSIPYASFRWSFASLDARATVFGRIIWASA